MKFCCWHWTTFHLSGLMSPSGFSMNSTPRCAAHKGQQKDTNNINPVWQFWTSEGQKISHVLPDVAWMNCHLLSLAIWLPQRYLVERSSSAKSVLGLRSAMGTQAGVSENVGQSSGPWWEFSSFGSELLMGIKAQFRFALFPIDQFHRNRTPPMLSIDPSDPFIWLRLRQRRTSSSARRKRGVKEAIESMALFWEKRQTH